MEIKPSVAALGKIFGGKARVVSKHPTLGVLQYSLGYEDEDSSVSMDVFPIAGEVAICLFVKKPMYVRLRVGDVASVIASVAEEEGEESRRVEVHFVNKASPPLCLSVQPTVLLTWAQAG